MTPQVTTRSKPIVKRAEDGFAIYGMEPPELAQSHGFFRLMFWKWVLLFALKAKDRELSRGLDKDGKPLRPISPQTRKTRRSAMTPSGKGDPSAPPLIPGWQKSRTRSLLKGRAYLDHADFFWAYDAFSGDSWATVLEYQAEAGRDVFGLGPAALKRVQVAALKRWEAYKAGRFVPKPEATELAPLRQERIDTPLLTEHAIGLSGPIKDRTGFMTQEQFRDYLRQTAPATLPGRPRTPVVKSPISGPGYNRLLSYVHQRRIVPGSPKPMKPPRPEPPKPFAPSGGPSKRDIDKWFATATKAKPKPAPEPPPKLKPIPAPTPVTARAFHDLVLEAVENVPFEQLWGSDAAYIHHVWEEYQKLPGAPPLTLEQFKQKLLASDVLRQRMHRADLANEMKIENVRAASTKQEIGYGLTIEYHFIRKAKKPK